MNNIFNYDIKKNLYLIYTNDKEKYSLLKYNLPFN